MNNPIVAHRGWSSLAPENTLSALELALKEDRIDKIEIDIQMTKDGIVVLHHDFELQRTSNGRGLLSTRSYKELLELDFGSWFSPKFKGEKIPTLEEALALVDNKKELIIEIKKGGTIYPTIAEELCKILKDYPIDKVMVKSFNHQVVKEVKDIHGDIKVGMLIYGSPNLLKEQIRYAHASFVSIAAPYITKEWIDNLYEEKVEVMAWTIDEPEDIEAIKQLDNRIAIITNYPQRAFNTI
ncbi:glycerophosphoryl diester phosphodiesterase [Anaerovirgula multivorans]|uniref:Glycerophosphoryl diester phosphodiesterase n=1 Tax=Anaerovirgula multivorans TaxID=312168 RepID=A0A239EI16_9FIRM|nr:glycerophosphodiester phosphodiesterase family protein [Anaerovirgula multivorans]SNS44295.1 glycerophosphoryl diester phosphodiesterase [Anaerovirgula multivorans]